MDRVPREAKVASLLLNASRVNECEPKVIQQLLEFMYRYVCEVLQEGLVYSEHAGRADIEVEDIRLAIKNQLRRIFIQPPSREFLLDLASRRNGLPLPIFDDHAGIRLPADQHTLLGASYRVTSARRPLPSVTNTDLLVATHSATSSSQKRKLSEE